MTPKTTNKEKLLIVLKEMDCEVSTKDLGLYIGINHKNIGRYLDVLAENKLISRKTVQEGKKRFVMNKILARGKSKKVSKTYAELMKEIETTDMKEAIDENNQTIEVITNMEKPKAERLVKQINNHVSNLINKDAHKAEILMIIKTIAIRTQDAKKHGFKTHQELTQHIIELILKL